MVDWSNGVGAPESVCPTQSVAYSSDMVQDQYQLETITKASQCADLLVGDIREAQKVACEGNVALEILLRDLIVDAVKIKSRLGELEVCFR